MGASVKERVVKMIRIYCRFSRGECFSDVKNLAQRSVGKVSQPKLPFGLSTDSFFLQPTLLGFLLSLVKPCYPSATSSQLLPLLLAFIGGL